MKTKKQTMGVIQFHTSFPVDLMKSQVCKAEDATKSRIGPFQPNVRMKSSSVKAEERDEASPSKSRKERLSHTSLRQVQATMKVENERAKEIIQPLLDTANGFVKELELSLSQWDVAEMRRRELQHKRWTERIWFPLQRSVEEHVSSCGPKEVKRQQSLYTDYLHYCNTKGFVFLETCDLREYNPFLLNIKWPHSFKLSTADVKDSSCFHVHETLKAERRARSGDAGCKNNRRQSQRPRTESVASHTDLHLQTSFTYPVATSGKTLLKVKSEGRKSSRVDRLPVHIRAAATLDGRCHQTCCWFSRCEDQQQPASLHQSSTASN